MLKQHGHHGMEVCLWAAEHCDAGGVATSSVLCRAGGLQKHMDSMLLLTLSRDQAWGPSTTFPACRRMQMLGCNNHKK